MVNQNVERWFVETLDENLRDENSDTSITIERVPGETLGNTRLKSLASSCVISNPYRGILFRLLNNLLLLILLLLIIIRVCFISIELFNLLYMNKFQKIVGIENVRCQTEDKLTRISKLITIKEPVKA